MAELLDAAFVRELEVLRRRLEIRARSGAAGEKVARRRGSSVEFQEHRAYAPGDDLRRIDWAAYARTGEPVLKLFRADEDVVLRVVCDASASMQIGAPSKVAVARRLAAALGYMTLARGERAQLVVASQSLPKWHAPKRGRSGLPPLLSALGAIEASGTADLARAVDAIIERSSRPGAVVVISDFFDPAPVLGALSHAVAAGHDVALLQVLAAEDVEPSFDGDLALEDVESGELVEVTADAAALDAYAKRLGEFFLELRTFARRHGATYVRTTTDESLEPCVRRFVAREVD